MALSEDWDRLLEEEDARFEEQMWMQDDEDEQEAEEEV
jgi:hypothetical protein